MKNGQDFGFSGEKRNRSIKSTGVSVSLSGEGQRIWQFRYIGRYWKEKLFVQAPTGVRENDGDDFSDCKAVGKDWERRFSI